MNLFDIMTGKISRMSYVNRYSSFPVNRRENVAEHSWWVAFVAKLIGEDLESKEHRIDFGTLLSKAIVHDLSEVVSGDIIRSYKHSNPDIHTAMERADRNNLTKLFGGDEYEAIGSLLWREWYTAKNASIEGQIVAFADMAVVMFYCREEDRSGNRAIREVVKEAYETWFSVFHDHPLLGQYIEQMFPKGRFFDMLREESLPAAAMFDPPAQPLMDPHTEGPTSAYDSAGWPKREGGAPLG